MTACPDTAATPPPPIGRVTAADRWAAWRAGATGPRITGFAWNPPPATEGSALRGQQLLAGDLVLGGQTTLVGDRDPWAMIPPNMAVQDALHGFGWLDDLASLPQNAGRAHAQAWLRGWLARHRRGGGPGWTVDLVARRQMHLIGQAAFVLPGLSDVDRARLLDLLGRQVGFLRARWRHADRGPARFQALCSVVTSACALGGLDATLKPALGILAQHCAETIDPDGGIATRNPTHLLAIFEMLTAVAACLQDSGKPADPAIDLAIARIAPTLRSLRHTDGTLPRMQGGDGGGPKRLDAALARIRLRPARRKGLAMGFARMGKGPASLIVDASPPALGPGSDAAHAASLAFELTSGPDAVVVSAGCGQRFGPAWQRAARATASHSTLSLAGYASARLARGSDRAGGAAQDFETGPSRIEVQQTELKTAEGLALNHDGWRRTHGLLHLRSLELEQDGALLRGQDRLAAITTDDRARLDRVLARLAQGQGDGLSYAVRFHLNPDAVAQIDQGGTAVSIRLPSGQIWVFRHAGEARLTLEPSVYFDASQPRPRATKQVVLTGQLTGYGSAVSWSLARPTGFLAAPATADIADTED